MPAPAYDDDPATLPCYPAASLWDTSSKFRLGHGSVILSGESRGRSTFNGLPSAALRFRRQIRSPLTSLGARPLGSLIGLVAARPFAALIAALVMLLVECLTTARKASP